MLPDKCYSNKLKRDYFTCKLHAFNTLKNYKQQVLKTCQKCKNESIKVCEIALKTGSKISNE